VPDEAAHIVRALLVADRNQRHARAHMTEAQRSASPVVDYRPFIVADADAGHGGEAHVRNLVRRFVEAGVPALHLEDQKPGAKKGGHLAGKVLVAQDEQLKRLGAARFQLDVMQVPGIVIARTDAASATLLDGRSDERDQPFILGATNINLPSFKAASLALLRRMHRLGVEALTGHALYAMSEDELAAADAWLDEQGFAPRIEAAASACLAGGLAGALAPLEALTGTLIEMWQADACVRTYGEAVADVMRFLASEGVLFPMSEQEWLAFAQRASFFTIHQKARDMGVHVVWDCEHAKTPDGYYQVRGGIDYAIAKALSAAPFADVLWMETKSPDLREAELFAAAIHAQFPDKMLAYDLSPSFSWDTTGMSDDQMRRFPKALGELGYVFNFITYGGHQIDGLAGEEFALALVEDGMLALARLQRKFRLLESPYRSPQALVGGPRSDAALLAISGRTATTRAMAQVVSQQQAALLSEIPPRLLTEWLELWGAHHGIGHALKAALRPHSAGSELLELCVLGPLGDKAANVIFDTIQDRRGRKILSVRDQNTFSEALRRRRLMTLAQLFLVHRYKIDSVHYLTPNEDNQRQTAGMKARRLFSAVNAEVGELIVADVDKERVKELVDGDRSALIALITSA
jgi:isocitrate lyase